MPRKLLKPSMETRHPSETIFVSLRRQNDCQLTRTSMTQSATSSRTILSALPLPLIFFACSLIVDQACSIALIRPLHSRTDLKPLGKPKVGGRGVRSILSLAYDKDNEKAGERPSAVRRAFDVRNGKYGAIRRRKSETADRTWSSPVEPF